jgi:hypothetical protein
MVLRFEVPSIDSSTCLATWSWTISVKISLSIVHQLEMLLKSRVLSGHQQKQLVSPSGQVQIVLRSSDAMLYWSLITQSQTSQTSHVKQTILLPLLVLFEYSLAKLMIELSQGFTQHLY